MVAGASMDTLLRLMNNIYSPQILGTNNAWPESIKKDFTNHFHKFMYSLTEVRGTRPPGYTLLLHALSSSPTPLPPSLPPLSHLSDDPRGRGQDGAVPAWQPFVHQRERHPVGRQEQGPRAAARGGGDPLDAADQAGGQQPR